MSNSKFIIFVILIFLAELIFRISFPNAVIIFPAFVVYYMLKHDNDNWIFRIIIASIFFDAVYGLQFGIYTLTIFLTALLFNSSKSIFILNNKSHLILSFLCGIGSIIFIFLLSISPYANINKMILVYTFFIGIMSFYIIYLLDKKLFIKNGFRKI